MQYSGHNTPLGHYTDRSPMGLGQHDGPGEYCDPHTASSVFLKLIFQDACVKSRNQPNSAAEPTWA